MANTHITIAIMKAFTAKYAVTLKEKKEKINKLKDEFKKVAPKSKKQKQAIINHVSKAVKRIHKIKKKNQKKKLEEIYTWFKFDAKKIATQIKNT